MPRDTNYQTIWEVILLDKLEMDLNRLKAPIDIREELARRIDDLKVFGPTAQRPNFATLRHPKHKNMKEIRLSADGGGWRAIYRFDPARKGIILVIGNKAGMHEGSKKLNKWYDALMAEAERRYQQYLQTRH